MRDSRAELLALIEAIKQQDSEGDLLGAKDAPETRRLRDNMWLTNKASNATPAPRTALRGSKAPSI